MRRAIGLILVLVLAGCDEIAHLDHDLTDGILVRAKFHPVALSEGRVPAGLPPHTFVRQPDGRVLYSDPEGCHCVYEGTEANLRAVSVQEDVLEQERDQSGGP